MGKKYSEVITEIIIKTKNIAERFGNNYIGIGHFILCFNEFNQNGRLHLNVTYKEKKDWIKSIKGKKLDHNFGDEFPFQKQLEVGLKSSSFHCKVMGDTVIMPEHIYLGILTADGNNKDEYLRLLKNNNIFLSRIKLFYINIFFNKICRKIGVTKILY